MGHIGEESRLGLAIEREPAVLLSQDSVALFELTSRRLARFKAARPSPDDDEDTQNRDRRPGENLSRPTKP